MSDRKQNPPSEEPPIVSDPATGGEATGATEAEAPAAEPTTPKGDEPRPWWKCRRLGVLAFLYVVLLGYFAATGLQEHSSKATGVARSVGACAPGNVQAGTVPAQLAPHGTQVESIAFGRGLNSQLREFEFSVTDPGGTLTDATCLPAHVNPFLRIGQAESAQLDPSRIDVAATVSGQQVLVSVMMRRDGADFAPAGSYAGTISLVDPRIERVDIPLAVSMAYPVWRLPLVVLLLVIPVAIGYLWLLKGSFHAGRPEATDATIIQLWQFDAYAFSRNGILAIGAGAAAAALVFSATYLSSQTWGASFVDAISLFGAMFAGFVAASTPVTAAGTDRSDSLNRTTPAENALAARR